MLRRRSHLVNLRVLHRFLPPRDHPDSQQDNRPAFLLLNLPGNLLGTQLPNHLVTLLGNLQHSLQVFPLSNHLPDRQDSQPHFQRLALLDIQLGNRRRCRRVNLRVIPRDNHLEDLR